MTSLTYGPHVVGRRLVRVRERHLAEHTARMLSSNAVGAAKLDLVVRGLALRSGPRSESGVVPPQIGWADLHDLCRQERVSSEAKRRWVGEQLRRLERHKLVRRDAGSVWNRPRVVVLRGDGTDALVDDPTGDPPDSYVVCSGWIFAGGWLKRWGAPELAAYLAAMIAERYARADPVLSEVWDLQNQALGTGKWYRSLSWFNDSHGRRPPQHVRVPFSERTLRRGFRSLISEGLVSTYSTTNDPKTGERFQEGPRTVYINRFNRLRPIEMDPWHGDAELEDSVALSAR